MSFKFINPGYINVFGMGSSIGSDENNTTYNPTNGVDFYSIGGFNFPISSAKEYWLKGNIYYSTGSGGDDENWFGLYTGNHHVRLRASNDNNSYGFYVRQDSTNLNTKVTVSLNTLHEVLLHVKSDATNGLIEFYMDGTLQFSYSGDVMEGKDITYATFKTYNWDGVNKYSNIIISDSEISLTEKVAILPLKNIETTWDEGSNGYLSASAVNQIINHTPDIDTLKSNLGLNTMNITGVQLSANSVSYSSSIINSLKTSVLYNSILYGSNNYTLSSNAISGKAWEKNPVDNNSWNLSNLNNVKLQLETVEV